MSSGDAPAARCKICGAEAVGPCARCRAMVCADCCELTAGAAKTFALCMGCAKTGDATLASAWRGLLGWIAMIVLPLVALAALVYLLRR
jgi:K+-transporting ATPase A subunit